MKSKTFSALRWLIAIGVVALSSFALADSCTDRNGSADCGDCGNHTMLCGVQEDCKWSELSGEQVCNCYLADSWWEEC